MSRNSPFSFIKSEWITAESFKIMFNLIVMKMNIKSGYHYSTYIKSGILSFNKEQNRYISNCVVPRLFFNMLQTKNQPQAYKNQLLQLAEYGKLAGEFNTANAKIYLCEEKINKEMLLDAFSNILTNVNRILNFKKINASAQQDNMHNARRKAVQGFYWYLISTVHKLWSVGVWKNKHDDALYVMQEVIKISRCANKFVNNMVNAEHKV